MSESRSTPSAGNDALEQRELEAEHRELTLDAREARIERREVAQSTRDEEADDRDWLADKREMRANLDSWVHHRREDDEDGDARGSAAQRRTQLRHDREGP